MKEQIGELLIDDNGKLSLRITSEMETNNKKINIKEKITEEDLKELSIALTKINEIIVSKINEAIIENEEKEIEETEKEENKEGENE